MVRMFLAHLAVFFQDDLFRLLKLVFARYVILAAARLTDEGDKYAFFFLSHGGIIY